MHTFRVLFRVDGGRLRGISLGHVFRCIALAKELQKNHRASVTFLMKDYEEGVAVVKNRGFDVQTINRNIEHDEEMEIIKQYNAEAFIFDLIDIGEKNTGILLNMKTLVMVIDDTGTKKIEADVVVNGNIAPEFHRYFPSGRQICYYLGPQYCILGEEFNNLPPRKVWSSVENILVSMGGSDPTGLTVKIVEILAGTVIKGTIFVVLGPAFSGQEKIRQIVSRSSNNFMIYNNVSNMAKIMRQTDVAICAGGRTVYELAATGTPSVLIPSVEHEVMFADALMRIQAGFCATLSIENLSEILSQLELLYDKNVRTVMSEKGQRLIDGKGYKRVASIITESIK